METLQIARSVHPNGFLERISALDGSPSEIFRTNEGVWCYFPEKKQGYYKPVPQVQIRIPFIEELNFDQLSKIYSISLLERTRVAGRWATHVALSAKDEYRYSLHLWVDEHTDLLLRSDLIDTAGRVIDSYSFVDLEVFETAAKPPIQPSFSGSNYRWFFDAPDTKEMNGRSNWSINMMPDGFKKIKHMESIASDVLNEKLFFSDGLASVMVTIHKYIEPEDHPNFDGFSRLGAVNAYGKIINDYQITVMGEVPPQTVYAIADAIAYKSVIRGAARRCDCP